MALTIRDYGRSRSTYPPTVRFDPLGPERARVGKRKLEDRDRLPKATAATDCHNLTVNLVDSLDLGRSAQDLDLEGHGEAVLEHGEETDTLFVVAVGIDNRFRDQRLEFGGARRPPPPRHPYPSGGLRAGHAVRSGCEIVFGAALTLAFSERDSRIG